MKGILSMEGAFSLCVVVAKIVGVSLLVFPISIGLAQQKHFVGWKEVKKYG